jgi:acyl-CoA thioesterase-1
VVKPTEEWDGHDRPSRLDRTAERGVFAERDGCRPLSLQYVPAVVALPDEEEYERVMAGVARALGVGLFRRFDIMRSWYDDGMPYAEYVQLDGLHLNDFGQKCIGQLLTRSILGAVSSP